MVSGGMRGSGGFSDNGGWTRLDLGVSCFGASGVLGRFSGGG